MRLNFFCDIDGTLLPFGKEVPRSAVDAIERARGDGHRFFLSTGRSPAEVDPRLKVIEFDGGVYSNGAIVTYHGDTILDKRMSDEDIDYLLGYAEKNGFLVMIQTDDGTYMSEETKEFFYSSMEAVSGHPIEVPNLITNDSLSFPRSEVRKFLFLSPFHKLDVSRKELSDRYQVIDNAVGIPQTDMVEVCMKGLNKGTGVITLIQSIGEDIESTVGIGDGSNDKEMISAAGLGIAMGNATDDVKKMADWVTTDVNDDGLKNAIVHAMMVLGAKQ